MYVCDFICGNFSQLFSQEVPSDSNLGIVECVVKFDIKSRMDLDGSGRTEVLNEIVEFKQRSPRSVIRWVTNNLLYRAPPCFRCNVKPLVPAKFAVISTMHAWWVMACALYVLSISKACVPAVRTLIG
jgi:hypothetical protein